MLRTVKVTPILTYTASDGRKYHEKAILSVAFNDNSELPISMIDIEPLFYDYDNTRGGKLYEAIIDGKTITVEMDIAFKMEAK